MPSAELPLAGRTSCPPGVPRTRYEVGTDQLQTYDGLVSDSHRTRPQHDELSSKCQLLILRTATGCALTVSPDDVLGTQPKDSGYVTPDEALTTSYEVLRTKVEYFVPCTTPCPPCTTHGAAVPSGKRLAPD